MDSPSPSDLYTHDNSIYESLKGFPFPCCLYLSSIVHSSRSNSPRHPHNSNPASPLIASISINTDNTKKKWRTLAEHYAINHALSPASIYLLEPLMPPDILSLVFHSEKYTDGMESIENFYLSLRYPHYRYLLWDTVQSSLPTLPNQIIDIIVQYASPPAIIGTSIDLLDERGKKLWYHGRICDIKYPPHGGWEFIQPDLAISGNREEDINVNTTHQYPTGIFNRNTSPIRQFNSHHCTRYNGNVAQSITQDIPLKSRNYQQQPPLQSVLGKLQRYYGSCNHTHDDVYHNTNTKQDDTNDKPNNNNTLSIYSHQDKAMNVDLSHHISPGTASWAVTGQPLSLPSIWPKLYNRLIRPHPPSSPLNPYISRIKKITRDAISNLLCGNLGNTARSCSTPQPSQPTTLPYLSPKYSAYHMHEDQSMETKENTSEIPQIPPQSSAKMRSHPLIVNYYGPSSSSVSSRSGRPAIFKQYDDDKSDTMVQPSSFWAPGIASVAMGPSEMTSVAYINTNHDNNTSNNHNTRTSSLSVRDRDSLRDHRTGEWFNGINNIPIQVLSNTSMADHLDIEKFMNPKDPSDPYISHSLCLRGQFHYETNPAACLPMSQRYDGFGYPIFNDNIVTISGDAIVGGVYKAGYGLHSRYMIPALDQGDAPSLQDIHPWPQKRRYSIYNTIQQSQLYLNVGISSSKSLEPYLTKSHIPQLSHYGINMESKTSQSHSTELCNGNARNNPDAMPHKRSISMINSDPKTIKPFVLSDDHFNRSHMRHKNTNNNNDDDDDDMIDDSDNYYDHAHHRHHHQQSNNNNNIRPSIGSIQAIHVTPTSCTYNNDSNHHPCPQILVAYVGWTSRWKEWLCVCSARIAPHNTRCTIGQSTAPDHALVSHLQCIPRPPRFSYNVNPFASLRMIHSIANSLSTHHKLPIAMSPILCQTLYKQILNHPALASYSPIFTKIMDNTLPHISDVDMLLYLGGCSLHSILSETHHSTTLDIVHRPCQTSLDELPTSIWEDQSSYDHVSSDIWHRILTLRPLYNQRYGGIQGYIKTKRLALGLDPKWA